MASPTLLMRVVASAYSVAEKAATIVRNVMATGDLGIVEKVFLLLCSSSTSFIKIRVKPEITIICVKFLICCKLVCLLDHVTVLIGIAYGGKAIAGVINQPYYNYEAGANATLGRTIWGVLGLGAFGFQLTEAPAGKHIIVTTRSHSSALVNDCISAMNPDNVIRVGGAGNKIIQLIEGKASAYVYASPGCKKWDTCAPEAILHAVGGKITDIHGNSFQYNKEVKHMNSAGVLATLRNYDYYASRIPSTVKQSLVP
uniref:3'(2'),5'-bisphosphate nucleotidase 1 n=1 Tax=Anas platyrhynchos platyrhynchos TaxID=8840 RepID=U3I7Y1_ANAPP